MRCAPILECKLAKNYKLWYKKLMWGERVLKRPKIMLGVVKALIQYGRLEIEAACVCCASRKVLEEARRMGCFPNETQINYLLQTSPYLRTSREGLSSEENLSPDSLQPPSFNESVVMLQLGLENLEAKRREVRRQVKEILRLALGRD